MMRKSRKKVKLNIKFNMDKKYLITVLIIGLVIALALVLGGYYYLSYSQGSLSLKLPTPQPAVSPVPPTATSQAQITISSKGFLPQTLLVKKGTKVTWTNTDKKPHQIFSDPHPSHSKLPALNQAKPLTPNSSDSYTFTTIGTFTYHDEENPLKFKGVVIVE